MRGTIRTLRPEEGYGFVRGPDGIDRFFHKTGVEVTGPGFEALRVGMTVEFESIDGPAGKGPRAIGVRVLE